MAKKYCPLLSSKKLTECLKAKCMLYKDKQCGLIGQQKPTAKDEKERLKELWDGKEEERPQTYQECSQKENGSCYYKDHGIKKYDYCLQCAQDQARWQDKANRWGAFIIKRKDS
jgi:hypothetical protein